MNHATATPTSASSRTRRALLALTIPAALAVPVAVPAPALAADGCPTYRAVMVQGWHETEVPGWGAPAKPMSLSATLVYRYCPTDAPATRKVQFIEEVTYCWHFPFGRPLGPDRFEGVSFNPYFYNNNGKAYNPGEKVVPDDGTLQNCKDQDLTSDAWWYLNTLPTWEVYTEQDIALATDPTYEFNYDGHDWRRINPFSDDILHYLLRPQR